jgi:hypothetical protein
MTVERSNCEDQLKTCTLRVPSLQSNHVIRVAAKMYLQEDADSDYAVFPG